MIVVIRSKEYDVSEAYFNELKQRYEEQIETGETSADSYQWLDENIPDHELEMNGAIQMGLSKEKAVEAFESLYKDIDKENHLFVGTINPQMIIRAINALKKEISETCERS